MTLDPVTLAVVQNGLRQVASEMDLVHEKTSFSPVISEGFDPPTASTIAQPAKSSPRRPLGPHGGCARGSSRDTAGGRWACARG